MSGSNKQGSDLFIVRLARDDDPERECDGEVVTRILVDDVMSHAGGLSMLGSVLAVPVHGGSPRQAKVLFYDLADPERPLRLAVEIAETGPEGILDCHDPASERTRSRGGAQSIRRPAAAD